MERAFKATIDAELKANVGTEAEERRIILDAQAAVDRAIAKLYDLRERKQGAPHSDPVGCGT